MPGYFVNKRLVIELTDERGELIAIVSNHEKRRSNLVYSVSELGFEEVHDLLNKITHSEKKHEIKQETEDEDLQ